MKIFDEIHRVQPLVPVWHNDEIHWCSEVTFYIARIKKLYDGSLIRFGIAHKMILFLGGSRTGTAQNEKTKAAQPISVPLDKSQHLCLRDHPAAHRLLEEAFDYGDVVGAGVGGEGV